MAIGLLCTRASLSFLHTSLHPHVIPGVKVTIPHFSCTSLSLYKLKVFGTCIFLSNTLKFPYCLEIHVIAGVWRKKWEKYSLRDILNLLESRLKKYYVSCRAFAFYHAAQQDE